MRSLLLLGLIFGSTAACSGGSGQGVYNGSDQATPPTDRQQSPANASQQAALDPQASPPLDPQSVAPINGNLGVRSSGSIPQLCTDLCQKNSVCESKPGEDCASSCAEGFTKVGVCAASLGAYLSCLLASPDYQCGKGAKDIPDIAVGCEAVALSYGSCIETLAKTGSGSPGEGSSGGTQGTQGTAGAPGRL